MFKLTTEEYNAMMGAFKEGADTHRIATEEFEGCNNVDITVRYDIGGYSYATGREKNRGYYLAVQPLKLEQKEGYQTTRIMGFSGINAFIGSPVTRKSAKARKAALADVTPELLERMITRIS